MGVMGPEREVLALKPPPPPAGTGVKAPEQQRLSRREMQATPIGCYRHADAEGLKQVGTILRDDEGETPDKAKFATGIFAKCSFYCRKVFIIRRGHGDGYRTEKAVRFRWMTGRYSCLFRKASLDAARQKAFVLLCSSKGLGLGYLASFSSCLYVPHKK